MKKQFSLLLIALLYSFAGTAQNYKIDSVWHKVHAFEKNNSYKTDTAYLNTLNHLAHLYQQVNPDTSLMLANKCFALSVNVVGSKVNALRNIGLALTTKGRYAEALSNFNIALALAQKNRIEKEIGKLYNSIAIVYKYQGKYTEAMNLYYKSLHVKEKIGDKKGIANSYGNIAIVYRKLKQYKLAEKTYQKALAIFTEIKDSSGISNSFYNLGSVCVSNHSYAQALKLFNRALAIQEKNNDKKSVAITLHNIGNVLSLLKQKHDALTYFLKALKMHQEVDNPAGVYEVYFSLSECYDGMHLNDKAFYYAKQASIIAEKFGNKDNNKDINEHLSYLYKKANDYREALYYYEKFKLYSDSLINNGRDWEIARLEAAFDFENKAVVLKTEQLEKEAIYLRENNKQKTLIVIILTGLVFSVLTLFFIIRSRRKLRHAYSQLQSANEAVQKQKNEIDLLNNTLQERVRERTLTLENANRKLTQYAFNNNHLVRRPVANILGLIKLFNYKDLSGAENEEVIKMITQSAHELDDIIREINKHLNTEDPREMGGNEA